MLPTHTQAERPRAHCPDDDLIERLSLGLVSSAEEDRLDDHLAVCPSCRARHEAHIAPIIETLRQSGPPETFTDDQKLSALMPKLKDLVGTGTQVQKPRPAPVSGSVRDCLAELGIALRPDEEPRIGKFRILSVLGQGGMGMVFRGHDEVIDREVAVKVMKPEVAAVPAYRERFAREARAAGRLQHDHIVPIFEVSEFRGVPYIVMPLMKGKSLHDLARERKLDYPTTIRILAQAAKGLAFAHEQGLIHRDIKMANLWVETQGKGQRVRILDFGLVHAAEDPKTPERLTLTGAMMGTPGYMSPEQCRGETLDGRADLFSLGCVLHEMLTGRSAFTGQTHLDVAVKVATEEPPTPRDLCPEVPEALSRLTMRLLRKRREERPATAGELLTELKSALQTKNVPLLPKIEPLANIEPRTEPLERPEPRPTPLSNADLTWVPPPRTSSRRQPRREASRKVPVALGTIGFLLLLLSGVVVYRISTDKGELVIESDDPEVKLKVEKNGEEVEIIDGKSGTTVRLRSGEYQVKPMGGAEVTVTPTTVRISRDGKVKLTVEHKPVTAVTKKTESPVVKPEPKPAAKGSEPPSKKVEPEPKKVEPEPKKVEPEPKKVEPEPKQIAQEPVDPKRPPMLDCTGSKGADADTVKRAQKQWADYLGVPVEAKVPLGGGVNMEFVLIPPGKFWMGTSEEEAADLKKKAYPNQLGIDEQLAWQQPQRVVTLTKAFYLGKFEVTNEEYCQLTGAKTSPNELGNSLSHKGSSAR